MKLVVWMALTLTYVLLKKLVICRVINKPGAAVKNMKIPPSTKQVTHYKRLHDTEQSCKLVLLVI